MGRIPYPVIDGKFVTVYRPQGDVYKGEDTFYFRKNTYYGSWTANDFSILNDNGTWHLVGITHPTPPDYVDEFTKISGNLHDAEHMLFHATASGATMSELMVDGAFFDKEKILYPMDREGEIPECHAPHLLPDGNGGFNIFYGPKYMRVANTKDFKSFECRTLFSDHGSARDPFVFEDNGLYYFVYAVCDRVDYRTTRDFVEFSEAKTLQKNFWGASSESPYMFKRNGYYYLMWAIFDRRGGSYDYRSYIFGGKTIEELANTAPIAMLPAHAGEIYSDDSGDYLLSVFYPENGVSIAPIKWIE